MVEAGKRVRVLVCSREEGRGRKTGEDVKEDLKLLDLKTELAQDRSPRRTSTVGRPISP